MAIIMGVLNVTPDSFYEGNRFIDLSKAIGQAHDMVNQGACIIDIGGESTRPGAAPIGVSEECDRVLPVLQALVKDFKTDKKITLSVDTRHVEVMRKAIALGADLINDINALQVALSDDFEALLKSLRENALEVCLMHMQGEPSTMQEAPFYNNVVKDIYAFFKNRLEFCLEHGLKANHIILDPGFGFGKTPQHNAELLKNLKEFKKLGCRLLVGLSRKSFIEKWLLKPIPPKDRLAGSLAAAVIAVLNGADIIRTHDVKATAESVKIAEMFKS